MALSEEQLEILADEYLTELYQELEREVIQDIARRVRGTERFTETAEIMAKSMAEHGFNPAEIYDAVMKSLGANEAYQEYIAENTRQYKREVMEKIRETEEAAKKAGNDLIAEAGNMAFNDDLQMWQQAGQDLPRPDSMEQLVNAFQRQTAGEIRNLTRTTGFRNTQLGTVATQQAFQRSLDLATLKMCTGAFSYDQACNDAIRQLAQSGLRQIKYESGRTYQLDTAVRMCVRTAASQLAGRVTEENCRKTGQDLVITSQHVGARPAHIEFENKVFSLSGKNKKYPAFSDPIEAGGAGYGEIGGIKGVNCRHNFYPFWEGISKIPPTLERPEPKEYNGKTYDYYQATQQQRAMEREIRALKREKYATDDPDERRELDRLIKQKTKEYNSFSDAMGIRAKENRLLMPGERNPYAGSARKSGAQGLNYADEALTRMLDPKTVREIKQTDDDVIAAFRVIFPGYTPGPLVSGAYSHYAYIKEVLPDYAYRIPREVVNTAIKSGTHNVDIGNPPLANSIHERVHDIITLIAMKRVGINDGAIISRETKENYVNELNKIYIGFYAECMTGDDENTIFREIVAEISPRAETPSEVLSECFVQYLGKEQHSPIAERGYNYLVKEWKKCMG